MSRSPKDTTGFSGSRRTFLLGAGASLALPFLESLWPARALAATPPPKRFLGYYVPCGKNMAAWKPATTGANYQLTQILQPLLPVRSKVLVLSNLANHPAQPDGPGDHASGTGAFLTAAHPFKTGGADIMDGISVDQVAANALGTKSTFPSLQLGTDGGGSVGDCDSGYSCAYARNISWAGPSTPLPKLTNPQFVFDRMFGGNDPRETAAQARKRLAYKTSILDYLKDDSARLRTRLGQTDRRKLDEYTGGVRALEMRLQEAASAPMCTPGQRPADMADYPTTASLMTDLMVVAFQCDLTRVISFMLGNAGSNQAYPFINVPNAHHELSHHMGDPTKLSLLALIDTWEMQQFASLLAKLDAIVESDGKTILDHSLVFYSSEISDGNAHNHNDMPVLLAGTASGALKVTGQHINYPQEQTFANLFCTLLNALDVPTTTFGKDGTGTIAGLI